MDQCEAQSTRYNGIVLDVKELLFIASYYTQLSVVIKILNFATKGQLFFSFNSHNKSVIEAFFRIKLCLNNPQKIIVKMFSL